MSAQLDRLKVLLVYSNAKMARLVKTVLRAFGMKEFQEAFSADQARESMRTFRPDIVILSANLEDGEYDEFVRWVRNDHDCPAPTTPIIITSSRAHRQAVIEAISSGADEFMSMPIIPGALAKRIEAVIFKPRPYIRAPGYFGPCRRRMRDKTYKGEERRQRQPTQKEA